MSDRTILFVSKGEEAASTAGAIGLVLLAAPALAEEGEDGVALYQAAEFDRAEAALEEGANALEMDVQVTRDGEIVVRPMMYLALSYDHRLIDGREAVTFLKRIVECVEDPERMLLEV